MPTLIFANGHLPDFSGMQELIAQAEHIIAVDGGANHCRRLGLIPHVLIGDLDSIDPAVQKELQNHKVVIHRHPPGKDHTDLELAVDLAMADGARQICLLGGLGGRWDMSLANLLLLGAEKYKALRFTVPGPDCVIHLLHPHETFALTGFAGQQVSFLVLQGDVQGLTLHGFLYPLANATLAFGATRGISNILVADKATVTFDSGLLLCVRLVPPGL